ncbi:uncharacterized protein [Triticum aestivum]|uniref:uncharacterized protein n=1 Tax=Triticum aestivum TaxID=4565 RepID=UPI001D031476|nr:uncharacterized protein LOC123076186 [Triticum aestivum]
MREKEDGSEGVVVGGWLDEGDGGGGVWNKDIPLNDAFVDKLPRLVAILGKDSVRLFLNLFKDDTLGLAWGFVITPQTFNQMIVQNALRCAKVALEGKAPELNGHRANPNYMNSCGYFPLHQAAEMFSADMIKLLFHYGASANLRTSSPEVIEGLLPLHVAVENACRHKFLEDNLLPDKENTDYVYMLIQLVCLPEMILPNMNYYCSITNEISNDGKLAETTVLLLAAQKKIRAGSSFKTTGNSKTDGFSIISNLCTKDLVAIDLEIAQNRAVKKQQLKAEKRLRRMALLLVIVISEAGEALDSYIRAHPEVPYATQVAHVEVLKRVSSILKNRRFFPTGECINIGNICPYDQQSSRLSGEELPNKYDGYATAEKAARMKQPRGWKLEHARRSFIPCLKSVLSSSKLEARASPIYPLIEIKSMRETEEIWNKSATEGSSSIPNKNLGLLGRVLQLTSSHQSRRLFGTAASTVLKLLKHA